MNEEAPRKAAWRTEPLLGGLALFLLLAGCAYVLKPFLGALMWAIILMPFSAALDANAKKQQAVPLTTKNPKIAIEELNHR